MDKTKIAKELVKLAKELTALGPDDYEINAWDYGSADNTKYEVSIFTDEDLAEETPEIRRNQARFAAELAKYLNRRFNVDATVRKEANGYRVYSGWTDDMYGYASEPGMKRILNKYKVLFES